MREGTGVRDNKRILYLFFLVIAGFLFFFCIGDRSYLLYKDSGWFIDRSRLSGGGLSYMLYPEFLRVCRVLFGENEEAFLGAAACIQGILGMVSSIVFAEYIRRAYDLRYTTAIAAYAAELGMYGWSLPEAVSSHYIITEGLAYPICTIMFICLFEHFRSGKYRMLAAALIIDVILALIRPQMMIFIPVTVFAVLLKHIFDRCKGDSLKKAAVTTLSGLGMILAGTVLAVIMMLVYVGRSSYPGQFENALIGKAVCLMEEEDGSLYGGYERDVFDIMYTEAKEGRRLRADFPASILEYEKLQRIIDRNIYKHNEPVWDYMHSVSEEFDAAGSFNMINRIAVTEVLAHKGRFVGIILRLIPSSFVASIFFQPPAIRAICYAITVLLYVFAIVLIICSLRRDDDIKHTVPLAVTLLFILCNVLSCNIILYGQQRYVVYCFGMFYAAVLIRTDALAKRSGTGNAREES